ncbi:cytochrome c [Fulvivirga sp. M361]|uniref:c-type cytochrome n=1 Tax=Fulvivirga sp. M361 TaxID=2594266 RepID=UPI00117B06FE|nr:c-type cytochrome [Fulvivirga sp. M361]TRX52010.1 cytochrome c [Fulvivirga sp. M361]
MKVSRCFLLIFLVLFLTSACKKEHSTDTKPEVEELRSVSQGIGAFKDIELTDPLITDLVSTGRKSYDTKCLGCHLLNDKRKVGPGWAGITNRRSPEWIMNMITNVNVMLEEDEAAQKLLEECMTHMPDQRIGTSEARSILEYMRRNDMDQVGSRDKAAM